MPYKVFVDGTVLSAADVIAISKDPLSADVATSQGTTSATYTDLATTGPAVTVTLVVGQTCTVEVVSEVTSSSSGVAGRASYAVSGAVTVAAADADSVANSLLSGLTASKQSVFTCTVAGSHTFTMKYRCNGAATGTFAQRRIYAKVH